MSINVKEKTINIKTCNSYTHLDNTKFMFIYDFSFIDSIWGGDFFNNLFSISTGENKWSDLQKCKYIENVYGFFHEDFLDKTFNEICIAAYNSGSGEIYSHPTENLIADRSYKDMLDYKPLYNKMKEAAEAKTYRLKSNITDVEKQLVFDIILEKVLNYNGNCADEKSLIYKFKKQIRKIIKPSSNNIQNVKKGSYVDIFWQKPSFDNSKKNEIGLRAEYYYDGNNWYPVSTLNLSDKRTHNTNSSEKGIKIPENYTCYIMLSDIKQSANRLEAMRKRLEKNEKTHWESIIKEFPEDDKEINLNSIFQTADLSRCSVIPPLNTYLEKVLSDKYYGVNNIILEENSDNPTIIVSDFSSYADSLSSQVEKNYSDYQSDIGEYFDLCQETYNLDALQREIEELQETIKKDEVKIVEAKKNAEEKLLGFVDASKARKLSEKVELNKQILEAKQKQIKSPDEKKLVNKIKFLVESTCNQYNNWDLVSRDKVIELKKDYDKQLINITKLELLSKKTAWWIFQRAYQELMYDYNFYYYYVERNEDEYGKKIEERYLRILRVISDYIEKEKEYYVENAIEKFRQILTQICERYITYDDFLTYLQYENDQFYDRLENKVSNLEIYTKYNSDNWFIEELYPNVLKPAYDISAEIISYYISTICFCVRKRTFTNNIRVHRILQTIFDFMGGELLRIHYIDKNKHSIKLNGMDYKKLYYVECTYEPFQKKEIKCKYPISIHGKIPKSLEKLVLTCNILLVSNAYNSAETEWGKGAALLQGLSLIADNCSAYLEKSTGEFLNKRAGNEILKKIMPKVVGEISSIIGIMASVLETIDFMSKGDNDAAIAKGIGIGFTAAYITLSILGISNPFCLLIFGIGIIFDVYSGTLETKLIEKWVRYTQFGCYYKDSSGWKYFLESELKEPFGNSLSDKDLRKKWINDFQYQIDIYYKILYQFNIEIIPIRPIRTQNDFLTILRIEVSPKYLSMSDKFEIKLELVGTNKKNEPIVVDNLTKEFIGDGENMNLYSISKTGFKGVFYLVKKEDSAVMEQIKHDGYVIFGDYSYDDFAKNELQIKTIPAKEFINNFEDWYCSSKPVADKNKIAKKWQLNIQVNYYFNAKSISLDNIEPSIIIKKTFDFKSLYSNNLNKYPYNNIGGY